MEIITIDDFLSDNECSQFIKNIEDKLPNARLVIENSKVADRFIDEAQTQEFTKRIKEKTGIDFIPSKYILTAKYVNGTHFGLHTDTPLSKETTHTMLIYLNDDYKGGHTVFRYPTQKTIIPKKGTALIFEMEDNMHEGQTVFGTKYWIGTQLEKVL